MPKAPTAPVQLVESPPLFTMPRVEVGQIVHWAYGPGEKPAPAIVLKVASNSIAIAIHVEGIKDHILKYGVRHTDDPFLRKSPAHDQGVWDLTPRDKMLNTLLSNLVAQTAEE